MIGGCDKGLGVEYSERLREFVRKFMFRAWPHCSYEVDEHGAEVFFFRDDASYASWKHEGATDENHDTMVHVIYSPTELWCVVSHVPGSETARLVDELFAQITQSPSVHGRPLPLSLKPGRAEHRRRSKEVRRG